jgi:hypothetical protein
MSPRPKMTSPSCTSHSCVMARTMVWTHIRKGCGWRTPHLRIVCKCSLKRESESINSLHIVPMLNTNLEMTVFIRRSLEVPPCDYEHICLVALILCIGYLLRLAYEVPFFYQFAGKDGCSTLPLVELCYCITLQPTLSAFPLSRRIVFPPPCARRLHSPPSVACGI